MWGGGVSRDPSREGLPSTQSCSFWVFLRLDGASEPEMFATFLEQLGALQFCFRPPGGKEGETLGGSPCWTRRVVRDGRPIWRKKKKKETDEKKRRWWTEQSKCVTFGCKEPSFGQSFCFVLFFHSLLREELLKTLVYSEKCTSGEWELLQQAPPNVSP